MRNSSSYLILVAMVAIHDSISSCPPVCITLLVANMNVGNLPSHHNIWRDAQVPQRTYSYYHPESRGLDFAGLMDDIKVIHFSIIIFNHILLFLTSCTVAPSCIKFFMFFLKQVATWKDLPFAK
jgi:hypothetical protein